MGDTDIDFESDSDLTPKKRCCWCNQNSKLISNKPYCRKCSNNCYKECIRCHKPYPSEKYFEKNDSRCNACQEKYLREKTKREQKKKSKDLSSSDEDVEPPSKKSKKQNEPVEDSSRIVVRNRGKKYLIIYETNNYQE